MSNELIIEKSWFRRNWRWVIPTTLIMVIAMVTLLSSKFGGLLGDYGKAYADTSLYAIPFEKVQVNERIKEVLGKIEPMGKMAILNGAVHYSEDNKTVDSTIKIFGEKGKAMLDISAEWINEAWHYKEIKVRIKNPPEKREVIKILN